MSQHDPPLSRQSISTAISPPYGSPSPSFIPAMQPQSQPPELTRPSPYSSNAHPIINHPHLTPLSGPPRVSSPMTGPAMNGFHSAPSAPGLMGPPSRPVEKAQKATDIRSLEDPLAGTGINLDEEERNLTNSTYYLQQPEANAPFRSQGATLATGSSANRSEQPGSISLQNGHDQDSEEAKRREQAEADFRAASWAQHPLWDAFLLGDPVEQKLSTFAYENGVKSPKEGLFLATKGPAKPQTTKVVGLDGATQIIDRGQTILSTESGEVLADIMKLVSLAARDRITGLLDHSGRLACERRDHSAGRIPRDWEHMAIPRPSPSVAPRLEEGAPASKSLKRTFSQRDEELRPTSSHKIVSVFRKVSDAIRDSEQARLAKRTKRSHIKVTDAGGSSGPATPSGVQTPLAAPAEPEKRLSKKDRKAVQDKMTDALQQKSANETARMAMGLGATNKFKKQYAWLNQGAARSPAGSLGQTPNKASTGLSSGQSTPGSAPPKAPLSRGKRLGDWNEAEDGGVHARDLLLALETDGKAVKALSKAYNIPDKPDKR